MKRAGLIIPLFTAMILMAGGLDSATLTYSIGDVSVKRGTAWRPGSPGMEISGGDIVKTGGKSLAIIAFSRGSVVRLRENTELAVTAAEAGGKESVSLNLSGGSVFSNVVKRLTGEKFQVNAMTVVASVRGTEFFFAYGKESAAGRDLWLCVNSGIVRVAHRTDPAKKADLKKGEGIMIKSGSVFTAPKRYPWTRGLNWNMDPSRGPVADTTDLDSAYTDLLNQDYD